MNKTLEQWAEDFNKKTPEKFVRDERYELFYLPDKGFCEIAATDKMIMIHQVSGDGKFWKDFAEKVARKMNLKVCGTICIRRQIKAWIRLFGYEVAEIENLPDGLKRYHCKNKIGKKGLLSPAYKYDSGEQAYFVTWEV